MGMETGELEQLNSRGDCGALKIPKLTVEFEDFLKMDFKDWIGCDVVGTIAPVRDPGDIKIRLY
jgi:hypothetical protein